MPDTNYDGVFYEEQTSPEDEDVEPEGERSLSQPFYCTISKSDGLTFLNFYGTIKEYLIEDPISHIPYISFIDESAFIDFIFLETGEHRIKLITEYATLVGYISIP